MTPRNGEADAAEADDYFTNCFLERKNKKSDGGDGGFVFV